MAPPPSLIAALVSVMLLLLAPSSLLALTDSKAQPECATSVGVGAGNSTASSTGDGFQTTVRSTLDEVQKLISLINTVSGGILGGGGRLSSAVSDCVDLLDSSADQLSWSSGQTAAASTTGNHRFDLRSWLSAALGNQDTCREGFEGTDGIIAALLSGGLDTISSLVSDSLRQIGPSFGSSFRRRRLLRTDGRDGGFPAWISAGDRRRLLQAAPSSSVDVVVAQDGSGNYTTVSAAVAAAPAESGKRYVIHVKRGIYKENVEIKKKKWNLMLIGEGIDATVISGNRNFNDGWTTFRSATFAVAGKGFIARDITFENSAGPEKHQAVALRSDSDLSVYYRCGIRGYQDTLYAHSLRQFYRECRISGTVDFIFGNAAAVFQNCQIVARKPLANQKNSITAQGRKDPNQNTGFSIQFSNISPDSDLMGSINQTYTYLGRPWKEYSRTVFMQSYIGNNIRPEGWLAWQGDFALDTLYYAEYMNYGPGSGLSNRVKWPGYHAISDSNQASNFTVAQFIDGNLWLPSTGVKYTAGLQV